MEDQISIAFACDDNYAKHVAVVIQSIFANSEPEEKHEFHLLTMGLESETEKRLQEVIANGGGTLKIHQIAEEKLIKFPNNRQTLNAYLRLFLPEILPDHNKVLYLDADLLVFTSLSSLWQHPLDNFAIAAATDSMFYFGGSAVEYFRALNSPPEHRYFNSGVMLLNLEFLRKFQLLKKVLDWVPDNAHLMGHSDQDALNAILIDKVSYLHVAWNLQIPLLYPVRFGWGSTQELVEAATKPAIIHYVTGRKPWFRQYKLPYQDLYFQYLAQTPWKDDPLPPYTLHQRLQRLSEELDWCYKWSRSEVRRLLGRHPKPVTEFSSTNTSPTALGTEH